MTSSCINAALQRISSTAEELETTNFVVESDLDPEELFAETYDGNRVGKTVLPKSYSIKFIRENIL